MTPEAKREKNRIANKKWRDANPEKHKENNRLKWIKHRHKHLEKYKEYSRIYYFKKKNKTSSEVIKTPTEKRNKLTMAYILDVLRKEPKHYLWNRNVKNWTKSDWEKFNILENGT